MYKRTEIKKGDIGYLYQDHNFLMKCVVAKIEHHNNTALTSDLHLEEIDGDTKCIHEADKVNGDFDMTSCSFYEERHKDKLIHELSKWQSNYEGYIDRFKKLKHKLEQL